MQPLDQILKTVQRQTTTASKKQEISVTAVKPFLDPEKARIIFMQILNEICLRNDPEKPLQLDTQMVKALDRIIPYANRELHKLQALKMSYKKGLFFVGNVGSGKTILLEAYCEFLRRLGAQVGYLFCTDIVDRFRKIDPDRNEQAAFLGIATYTNKLDKVQRAFDDLGDEDATVNYYGDRIGIMTLVLSARYKAYIDLGTKTHITTNLTEEQLAERYGERIQSRSFEMFNIIQLGTGEDYKDYRRI